MEQNLVIKNKDCGSIEKSVQSEAKPSKIYRIVYVIFQLYLKKENMVKKDWKQILSKQFYMTGENMGKFFYFSEFQILFN